MDQATGFLRPELLWLALAAPVLLALALVSDTQRRRALALFAGRGVRHVARSATRRRAKIALGVAAVALVGVAAAGPYVDERQRDIRHRGVDVVIAVDTSQSMAVRDVRTGDRLALARQSVEALSARLTGSRIALVLFANEGVVRYPATTDPELLGQVLDHSARGYRLPAGSSLRAGLAAALTGFPDEVREAQGAKAVLVISDGEYPADDVPDLAPYLEREIRIFSIGVGTAEGGRIPLYDNDGRPTGFLGAAGGAPAISRLVEAPLRSAAESTGGRFWQHTGDGAVIGEAVQALRALDTSEIVQEGGTTPDDRYQLVLAIAIALLLAEWLLDDRVAMPAPRSARPVPPRRRRWRLPSTPRWVRVGSLALIAVVGASCTDALAEQNQAANTLFSRGDYRGALARYRDLQADRPELLELSVNAGNALYRMQEHSRALADHEIASASEDQKVRLNAHYGRGSALFRLGRLDEAREAFKDALRTDPSDRDSKFNIEVIDRLRAAPPDQNAQEQQPGPPGPGASGQPGQGQPGQGQPGGAGPSAAPGASAPPGQPGASADPSAAPGGASGQPGGPPIVTLDQALLEFRRDLTPEDALRLLDALIREQGGIEGLIEGTPREGDEQQPY